MHSTSTYILNYFGNYLFDKNDFSLKLTDKHPFQIRSKYIFKNQNNCHF